jgi:nitrite reductase (NO-forming)
MAALYTLLLFALLAITGCATQGADAAQGNNSGLEAAVEASDFTLETALVNGRMAFVGRGGTIDGVANPDLHAAAGDDLLITLVNQDGMAHDLAIPQLGVKSSLVSSEDSFASVRLTLGEDREGVFVYYCTVPGHRQAGMEGRLVVHPYAQDPSLTGG